MIIASAYNPSFEEIGSLSSASIQAYGNHFSIRTEIWDINPNFSLLPSWFKIPMIRYLIEEDDIVLWVDADAIMIPTWDIRAYTTPHGETLHIAQDINGINCGVMAWRNNDESRRILDQVMEMSNKYAEHPWFEQAAIMELLPNVSHYIQPKDVWNAYVGEETPQTIIRHFPGISNDKRLEIMRGIPQSTEQLQSEAESMEEAEI